MKRPLDPGAIQADDELAQAFAEQVLAWCARAGADPQGAGLASQAAAAVSRATTTGSVCLSLKALAAELGQASTHPLEPASLRPLLLASGVVGTPQDSAAFPLILDDEDRLYLHRYFDYERRLAQRLARALTVHGGQAPPAVNESVVGPLLADLFRANEQKLAGQVDWQKVAAAMALRGRLTVISGGPGTGKTTTVVNLLACLLSQDPQCRVMLAAPTGKAAVRMMEALVKRASHLPPDLRARLPTQAFTIHRLLGLNPSSGRLEHHPGNLLALDVLVIDEASMLGVALAVRLLEAVPDSARIVLLGDHEQLTAVEAGSVFSELSADPGLTSTGREALARMCKIPPDQLQAPVTQRTSPLKDTTAWFTQNFRFDAASGIGRLAEVVKGGLAHEALDWLRRGDDESVRWIEDSGARMGQEAVDRLLRGYDGYFQALRRDPRDVAAVTQAFGWFRALCAVNEGPRGMQALNEQLVRHARRILGAVQLDSGEGPRSAWFVGRPVMVLRNDYRLSLFNGDIGIALPDGSGRLMVAFADGEGGFRWVAPVAVPEHQDAFAMTVHKSQGSEFEEVMVLLPSAQTRGLTRELLYTAVTRAARRVTLVCEADAFTQAVSKSADRHTGLLARLAEACAYPGSTRFQCNK